MKKRSTFLQLKESERSRRRNLILDAAMHLFASKSFHQIGMRDIADEAGISPASIYRYFSSRDDICAEILGHEIKKGRNRQHERLESGQTSLEDIASGMVDFFLEKKGTFQMLGYFLLSEEVDKEARDKFHYVQDYYLNEFDKVLIEMGCPQENVRLFSMAFLASILGTILSFRNSEEWEKESSSQYVHRLAKFIASIFKTSIC